MKWVGLCLLAVTAGVVQAQVNYPPSSVTPSDLASAAAQNLAIMAATTPQFVGGSSAYQTKEALQATYPCSAAILGQVANVNNLYGGYSRRLQCETDAISGLYYYYPENPDGAMQITQTSGTYSVTTLGSPPTLYIPNPPAGTLNVSFTVPCVPGDTKHVIMPATLGTGAVNLTGLLGGGTVTPLQGSDKLVTCIGGTGWKSN